MKDARAELIERVAALEVLQEACTFEIKTVEPDHSILLGGEYHSITLALGETCTWVAPPKIDVDTTQLLAGTGITREEIDAMKRIVIERMRNRAGITPKPIS